MLKDWTNNILKDLIYLYYYKNIELMEIKNY